jgi:hypothetical protein
MTKLQLERKCLPSTSKCDLDLLGSDMDVSRDTLSGCGRHLCQVIKKILQ